MKCFCRLFSCSTRSESVAGRSDWNWATNFFYDMVYGRIGLLEVRRKELLHVRAISELVAEIRTLIWLSVDMASPRLATGGRSLPHLEAIGLCLTAESSEREARQLLLKDDITVGVWFAGVSPVNGLGASPEISVVLSPDRSSFGVTKQHNVLIIFFFRALPLLPFLLITTNIFNDERLIIRTQSAGTSLGRSGLFLSSPIPKFTTTL
jgi:hypothetical protein